MRGRDEPERGPDEPERGPDEPENARAESEHGRAELDHVAGQTRSRRRRGHRRVDAPPTNPEADQADDVAPAGPRRTVARDPQDTTTQTPRERWIRSQRPPHWD